MINHIKLMNNLLVKKKSFLSISEMFSIDSPFTLITGPCSIESYEQMELVAKYMVKSGLKFIRGGAFKPRTSPYDFQGLGYEGIKILYNIKKMYDLISVTEVMDTRDVETVSFYSDIIQIGSRNMANFSLLKEVGKVSNPILLKRGMMSTIEEFILAAEYIISSGNQKVIMCERGIRTFEDSTRNTLDIACIPIVKNRTNLPIIVDLSHSLGRKDIIIPIAKAVKAANSDGIMIEVHPEPESALSDKKQQLDIEELNLLLKAINYMDVN